MTNQNLLLGIDVSTTGAKALLIDAAGNVVGTATTRWSCRHRGRFGQSKILTTGGQEQCEASAGCLAIPGSLVRIFLQLD